MVKQDYYAFVTFCIDVPQDMAFSLAATVVLQLDAAFGAELADDCMDYRVVSFGISDELVA